MSKPKFAIAPRKPVSEIAARQLEEALERKSEGVAGVAPSLATTLPVVVQTEVEEIKAPPPVRELRAAPPAASPAPEPEPPAPALRAEVAPTHENTASSSQTSAKSNAKARTASAPSVPSTGLGTRANPRIRKNDGVKTRSTSVHLPVDLALKLTMYCARFGRRQSEVITQAVDTWLSQND
jgi:hypothetical protein